MPTQTKLNPYGKLCSEIYVLDKPPGSLPDVPFYQQRLAGLDGPILEPAVGSGRMLIPLLEAGHDAEGFDASAEMLAYCRAECAARGFSPRLQEARFQDFTCDRTFAAIIVPVQTFTFVDDFDEALAVLARFREALRPGGLLMIDMPVPRTFWDGEVIRAWTAENGDLLRFEQRKVDTDPIRQRAVSHMIYQRFRDGRLLETELEVMAGRYWGLEEFRMALKEAGFGEISVYADYRPDKPPSRSSRTLTFEAHSPS